MPLTLLSSATAAALLPVGPVLTSSRPSLCWSFESPVVQAESVYVPVGVVAGYVPALAAASSVASSATNGAFCSRFLTSATSLYGLSYLLVCLGRPASPRAGGARELLGTDLKGIRAARDAERSSQRGP